MQEALILTSIIILGIAALVFDYHYTVKRALRYMKENNLSKQNLKDRIEIYED
ncbi:hypothetical protein X560_1362 [Listeria fleischmannii 1991]|uniref:Uncharacterized protein n=2 Tax=Listeria fleischmannii TaxID=1069827 RepID=A0A2X3GXA3_9LIST|nr:hypothetical protein [Listeria fleischmannii]KMT59423.1 hypothetical protein X560_1362 [Listeria fleischmannii 1991]SQC66926.1 Uncharacterised protein [Listeria fleischmannii subsp. fleischmannii]